MQQLLAENLVEHLKASDFARIAKNANINQNIIIKIIKEQCLREARLGNFQAECKVPEGYPTAIINLLTQEGFNVQKIHKDKFLIKW